MSIYRALKTDTDLFAAAITGTRVYIFENGKIVDYGGNIEKYTQVTVKIGGTYYFRSNNEIRAEVK